MSLVFMGLLSVACNQGGSGGGITTKTFTVETPSGQYWGTCGSEIISAYNSVVGTCKGVRTVARKQSCDNDVDYFLKRYRGISCTAMLNGHEVTVNDSFVRNLQFSALGISSLFFSDIVKNTSDEMGAHLENFSVFIDKLLPSDNLPASLKFFEAVSIESSVANSLIPLMKISALTMDDNGNKVMITPETVSIIQKILKSLQTFYERLDHQFDPVTETFYNDKLNTALTAL